MPVNTAMITPAPGMILSVPWVTEALYFLPLLALQLFSENNYKTT